MSDRAELATALCEEFCSIVDRIHGAFLDATMAMGTLAENYMEWHTTRLRKLDEENVAITPAILNPEVTYKGSIKGEPGDLHATRLQDLIRRNAAGGGNWLFLANMCLVAVYHYWEDHYRGKLAELLGLESSSLQSEVFGELRHLRRSIIHNRGVALPEVARATFLKSFPPGAPIFFTPHDIHDIADTLKKASRSLTQSHIRLLHN